jgi:hypothetical protein
MGADARGIRQAVAPGCKSWACACVTVGITSALMAAVPNTSVTFRPLAQIRADPQVSRVLGDELDPVAETVCRDHLSCLGGAPGCLLAARHPFRAGARSHHREKAGTSSDIQDRPSRRATPNRLLIRHVSRHIIHHREMPRRHRLLEHGIEIDACIRLKRVDLHRPPERRHRLDDMAFGEVKSADVANRIGVVGLISSARMKVR